MNSDKEYTSNYLDKSILEDIFIPTDPKSAEGFENFLKIFDDSCENNIAKLSSAAAELNYDNILAVAHNFKGIAGNIGASKLANLCCDLEKFGKIKSAEEI